MIDTLIIGGKEKTAEAVLLVGIKPDGSLGALSINSQGQLVTTATGGGGSGEPALGNPAADGYLLTSTAAGVRSWKDPATLIINKIVDSTDPLKILQIDISAFPEGTKTLVFDAAGTVSLAGIGATTVGGNLLRATNPSAITFPKVAADNTVSFRTPAQVLSDIGAQASGSYAASGANADITSASGFTGAITTPTKATFSTGTITTSQPIFDLSQTWNASGTAFTAIKLNITNTQSASTSILQDWEVGGVSQAVVNAGGKIGASTLNGDGVSIFFIGNAVSQTISGSVTQRKGLWQYNSFTNSNGLIIKWSSADDTTSSVDTGIARNGAGVAEVNNGTAISGSSNAGSIKALTFIPVGTATTCTGATIGTGSKSNAGFVTATTTGTSTIVITFPVTAPTGWNVYASDGTALTNLVQTASSTTTATLSGTTASGDVIRYIAMPY